MHSCIHLTLISYDHKFSKRLDLVSIWSFDEFSSLYLRFLIIKPISHLTMVCYHQNPVRRTLRLTILNLGFTIPSPFDLPWVVSSSMFSWGIWVLVHLFIVWWIETISYSITLATSTVMSMTISMIILISFIKVFSSHTSYRKSLPMLKLNIYDDTREPLTT